ncbi:MAG: hypothetical protein QGI08_14800 [Paracoccaceae bacterium]|jgi:hypothetical protein|nr:hypothetical protein [Paracoccaceae bacterium]MDP7186984.1 hypothetical protein [Paracoccaceae bacterium]
MSEQEEIYRIAGEALELSQMLEQALTIPIMMLFMIESGWQKDIASKEIETLIEESTLGSTAVKSQPVNERFRQNIRAQVGQITLLVQNGSMGELKKALESRLHVTPGGPSAFLHVLQDALDSRNYLCHTFFKDSVESSAREDGNFDAIAKLREIETSLRKAISFANGLADTLRQQFPQTFESDSKTVH